MTPNPTGHWRAALVSVATAQALWALTQTSGTERGARKGEGKTLPLIISGPTLSPSAAIGKASPGRGDRLADPDTEQLCPSRTSHPLLSGPARGGPLRVSLGLFFSTAACGEG